MTADERIALERMTVREIRRAQGIVRAQLPMAYEQRNTDALVTLQAWDDSYTEELVRRFAVG
jgi:hypothetical protein